jgi:uncharacterized protein YbjQ (UPF0145 family)
MMPQHLSTTATLPGYDVIECLGIVMGTSIRSRPITSIFFALFSSIQGSKLSQLSVDRLCEQARTKAMEELKSAAERLYADAVVGIKLTFIPISHGMVEVVISGTAVKTKIKEDVKHLPL